MTEAGLAPVIVILMKKEQLGDAITHVPALRALRVACPDHRIVGLYRGETVWTGSLARMKNEFFDEIRLWSSSQDTIRSLRGLLAGIPGLTTVIDFRSNGRAILSYLATAGLGVRYAANVAGFILRHGLPRRWMFRPGANARRYHKIAELIVGRVLPFNARLDVSDSDHRLAERLLGHVERFVCLAPGPTSSRKFWSKDNWVRLARRFVAEGITPVILLGPNEDNNCDWVRDKIDGAIIVDRAAADNHERLPWLFLAIADRAIGAVTYEGGIGHLIATTGLPLLTISGPTNAERWQPVTSSHWDVCSRQYGSRDTAAVPFDDVLGRVREMIDFSDRFYRPARSERHRRDAKKNSAEVLEFKSVRVD